MTSLTVELQDETYRRLRELAEARGVTLDSLIETLGSAAISAHPAESRFRAAAPESQRRAGA